MQVARKTFPGACEPVWIPAYHISWDGLPGQEPHAAFADPYGYLTGRPCSIYFNERIHTYSVAAVCTTVVHEYGHLAGLGHSGNDKSVMAAPWTRIFPGCQPRKERLRAKAARRHRRTAKTDGGRGEQR